ncbi:MAG: 2-phospho-L-lactate guanylyltransferase [Dermatophilaceae bacterium]
MQTPLAPTPDLTESWRVVVPIKDTRVGKSRLAPVGGAQRQQLSLAIADDTVRAVVGTVGPTRVLLVTSDVQLRHRWLAAGVGVLEDPGTGLNGAVEAGLLALGAVPGPVAVVLGDTPALQPPDLRMALDAALEHPSSFVPDAAGTGTVLLCHRDTPPPFGPSFGVGSAAAHEQLGAWRLELDLPRLRTDVDDDESLAAARGLGLGCATRAALDRLLTEATKPTKD